MRSILPLDIHFGDLCTDRLWIIFRMCPVPTVSTLHTVFPQDEYRAYVKDRALRKEGRFGFLPRPLRASYEKMGNGGSDMISCFR